MLQLILKKFPNGYREMICIIKEKLKEEDYGNKNKFKNLRIKSPST